MATGDTATGDTLPTARASVEKRSGLPDDFVVPLVHLHLPEPVVKAGFYGGLAAAVALGAMDLPLAALVGVGVAIAGHRRA
jgi:hypothetical protein